jgi:hypothetical protein
VVGLAADDAAQRDQCVVTGRFSHGLQGHGHFQCAGHLDQVDLVIMHAELAQLRFARLCQGVGDPGIEACLHNAYSSFLPLRRSSPASIFPLSAPNMCVFRWCVE